MDKELVMKVGLGYIDWMMERILIDKSEDITSDKVYENNGFYLLDANHDELFIPSKFSQHFREDDDAKNSSELNRFRTFYDSKIKDNGFYILYVPSPYPKAFDIMFYHFKIKNRYEVGDATIKFIHNENYIGRTKIATPDWLASDSKDLSPEYINFIHKLVESIDNNSCENYFKYNNRPYPFIS
jgi:hypothetical protein